MSRPSKQEHVRSFENTYASGWRRSSTTHHRFIFRAAPFFKDRGIETILDIGCGHGHVFDHLSADGFDLTGTEIVPCLLRGPLKGKCVLPFDIDRLKLINDQFDLVLMVDLLDHLRDLEEVKEAIGHADRLARKGIIVTLGGLSTMRTIEESRSWWRDTLEESVGFPLETAKADGGFDCYIFWKPTE